MRRRMMLKSTAVSLNNFAPKAPTTGPGSSTGTYAVLDDGTWVFTPTIERWKRMPFELKTPIPITQGDVIKLTVINSAGSAYQIRIALNSTEDWSSRIVPSTGAVYTVNATSAMNLERFEMEFNVNFTGELSIKFSLSINDVVIF